MEKRQDVLLSMFTSFIISFSAALVVFKVPSHLEALIADFDLSYTLAGFSWVWSGIGGHHCYTGRDNDIALRN